MRTFSWKIITDKLLIKYLDYSCFKSSETGIPKQEILPLFLGKNFNKASQKRQLKLLYKSQVHHANIRVDKSFRAKLIWGQNFVNLLEQFIPDWRIILPPHKSCTQIGCPFISFLQIEADTNEIDIHHNSTYYEETKVPKLVDNILYKDSDSIKTKKLTSICNTSNAKKNRRYW